MSVLPFAPVLSLQAAPLLFKSHFNMFFMLMQHIFWSSKNTFAMADGGVAYNL